MRIDSINKSLFAALCIWALSATPEVFGQQRQEVLEKGLQRATAGIAKNMEIAMRKEKLLNKKEKLLNNGGKRLNLYVLPIRDERGNATKLSLNLTEKVAQQLRLKLVRYGYVVDSFEHLSDKEVIEAIKKTQLSNNSDRAESALNEQIVQLHEVDYLFKANYTETSSRVVIENARLLNNYTKSRERLSLPAEDSESLLDGRFGFSPVWQSMLLPGLGQLRKGQSTKGALILTGSLLMGAGVAVSETMRGISYTKALQTTDINQRRAHLTNAQSWEVTRNVVIAVGGALYLYNVIDAIGSKKGRLRLNDYQLSMSPDGEGAVFGYRRTF